MPRSKELPKPSWKLLSEEFFFLQSIRVFFLCVFCLFFWSELPISLDSSPDLFQWIDTHLSTEVSLAKSSDTSCIHYKWMKKPYMLRKHLNWATTTCCRWIVLCYQGLGILRQTNSVQIIGDKTSGEVSEYPRLTRQSRNTDLTYLTLIN